MAIQKIALQVGTGLTPSELLGALEDHKSEIKGLLVANIEHISVRATCDGFDLEKIVEDDGSLSLKYSYGWSAYYGCKDADDGGTEYEEIPIQYENGIVTIEHDVKPERFPNEEF